MSEMPAPGSPEWRQRKQALLDSERGNPATWWYLSFAAGKFLGAAIVRAPGFTSAIQRTIQLGINPGGEVQGWNVPNVTVPAGFTDRLLSREDLHKLDEAAGIFRT